MLPLFLCKNETMNEKILLMVCMGFTPHEAYKTYWDFMKNYSEKEFKEYLRDLERDTGVDKV